MVLVAVCDHMVIGQNVPCIGVHDHTRTDADLLFRLLRQFLWRIEKVAKQRAKLGRTTGFNGKVQNGISCQRYQRRDRWNAAFIFSFRNLRTGGPVKPTKIISEKVKNALIFM